MRRWLFAGVMLIASPGWAEWQFVGGTARADYYIEAASVRADGSRRQVLELLDLKVPDTRGNRSYLALYEYDCPTGAARILRSACFDGAMGGGRQTEACDTPGPWTLPGDASASMAKLRIVCGP